MIHDGRFTGESWADWIRWIAGFEGRIDVMPYELATAILGPDGVREWDLERNASLQQFGERWFIFIRPGAGQEYRDFAIAHELGEYALMGKSGAAKEKACDAIAYAILGRPTGDVFVVEDGLVYEDSAMTGPPSTSFDPESVSKVRFRSLLPIALDDDDAPISQAG